MYEFADILNHPRYRLQRHRPMQAVGRAAQFSAFAALSGFDEEIDESARLTSSRANMAEDDLAELDAAFQRLLASESEQPTVTVAYFRPDSRKAGGAYIMFTGQFRHFDAEEEMLRFTDGTAVSLHDICMIVPAEQGSSR